MNEFNIEALTSFLNAWAVVGAISGVVGVGLYTRHKIDDHTDQLEKIEQRQDEHEDDDMSAHQRVVDRLARIETKIDVLMDRPTDQEE